MGGRQQRVYVRCWSTPRKCHMMLLGESVDCRVSVAIRRPVGCWSSDVLETRRRSRGDGIFQWRVSILVLVSLADLACAGMHCVWVIVFADQSHASSHPVYEQISAGTHFYRCFNQGWIFYLIHCKLKNCLFLIIILIYIYIYTYTYIYSLHIFILIFYTYMLVMSLISNSRLLFV